MDAIILASGVTPKGLFNDYYSNIPKSIMPIFEDGSTVLDFQMCLLKGFNIYIVVGFQSEMIKKYCVDKGYKVNFIEDRGWTGEYSSNRTLTEIAPTLLTFDEFILMFGDVIFEKNVIQYLSESKADICNAIEKKQLFKFTRRGFAAVLKHITKEPTLGIGTRMLGELRNEVKIEQTPIVAQQDLDRLEDIRPMRETFKYLFDR